MREETQHLLRKVRDARPLFHRTEKDLMVKGSGISSAFLSSPHRLRTSVPIDGDTRMIIVYRHKYNKPQICVVELVSQIVETYEMP